MSFVNIDCVKAIKKLQHQTGQNLLKSLTDIYFSQAPEALSKMKVALAKADLETLKREAHSLKSSSATLGVLKILEICKSIEDETTLEKQPSVDRLQSLVSQLEIVTGPSLDELRNVMQREG